MWVDAIMLLGFVVLLILLIDGAYQLGKDRGYDDGY